MASFRCYLVKKSGDHVERGVAEIADDKFPVGAVTVRVAYSSLNYKDALASTGHAGIAKTFPLVPGIDAVGEIVESQSPEFAAGTRVLIANENFGTAAWGGWGEIAKVPAEWLLPLPAGLEMLDAMIYGTAGFTAAQCIEALIAHNVAAGDGPIVVTGATGGVGIMAVKMLAKLGYQVVASTGKADQGSWLKEHGAAKVVSRDELVDDSQRPMLSARWAGAVDTVGGKTLGTVIRSAKPAACITACGMVGGADLPISVYPFILRGVTLQGIDSAGINNQRRIEVWNRIANEWKLPDLKSLATIVPLEELDPQVDKILAGGVAGRVVVSMQ